MKIAIAFEDLAEQRYKRIKTVTFWALVTVVLVFSIVFINSCIPQPASAEEVNMDIIATIESNNNPNAISYRGAKYGRGLCQVSEICLEEFNKLHQNTTKEKECPFCHTKPNCLVVNSHTWICPPATKEILFFADCNMFIANWYMNKRIPQMIKYFNILDSIDNRLIAYNWGIGNLNKWVKTYTGVFVIYNEKEFNQHLTSNPNKFLPQETQNYIKKYHQLERSIK